ncbi:MAG: hypothetical protein RL413_1171 [Actinomycetota bacterium]
MASDTLYLVRHAKAGERAKWEGDDKLRPLSKKGWRQAEALAVRLAPLVSPSSLLVSSPYVRCRQTLEPLDRTVALGIREETRLAEGYDRDGALELIDSLPNGSVMCSHGDVIPDVMAALQRRGTEFVTDPDWRKATVWVLSRVGDLVETAACWPPPPDGD